MEDLPEEVCAHAWDWFSLHAAQRMQTFNFFLVAAAFLIAAYASLLEKYPWAALIVGLVGAWTSFWFTRLDNRTRQLVNAGQDVLKVYQKKLAQRAQLPALEILEKVETASCDAFSYRVVIAVIEWTMVALFLLAVAFAGYHSLSDASSCGPG